MKKNYLVLLLCFLCFTVSAQDIFQPASMASFTGGGTYCQGSTGAPPLTFTYNTCNNGTGALTGTPATITWYYNTTNSTTISTATVATGPNSFTTPTTATGTQTLVPPTATAGTFYYFCVITWSGGTAACPGGASGAITSSTTQVVNITATLPTIMPGAAFTPDSVCVGSMLNLTDAAAGGGWTTTDASIASVTATSGVVSGISSGNAIITYSLGGCYTTKFITVNDTPVAITPTGNPYNICQDHPTALHDATAGGAWTSSAPGIASVGFGTGVVTGTTFGTARITYRITTTGCQTTRVVSVIANPAAITGTTSVCAGSNTLLSDASAPGTWSSSATTIATVNATGLVHGTSAGISVITFSIGSGCYSTTVVTVGAMPAGLTGTVSVICASGGSLNFGETTTGGMWTSSNTGIATVGSTGHVTGVDAGVATISYTTPGCTAATRSVTVNPIPTPITGILSACNGLTTTLHNTVTGGTWTSSDTTVAKINSGSGIVSGLMMGTTVITYKAASGCYVTAVVTVNPLAPILGSDTICVGATTALTNIVGGGTWASSNPANATIGATSGLVTGLVDGITFVVYTLPTACSTSFFLRVLPAVPAIAGVQKLCSGSIATLSDVYAGGTWTTNNPSVAGIDDTTGLLSGMFPDTTTITYRVYGCQVSAVVTVNPLPDAVITHNWTTHTISVQTYFTSYQWYDSSAGDAAGNIIAGATNYSLVIPRINKYYRVAVTDTNGCVKSTDWKYRDYLTVANVAEASVNVYPNPATTTVFVDAPVSLKATLTGIEGRVIAVQEDAHTIDISKLSPGMYLLSLTDDKGQVITVRKLIKE